MALDRTAGYDMLVQISETEINTQLATAFLAGGAFPPSLAVPVNTGGVVGTATLNFDTPVADFDRPRPQMGLTLPFSNSQLQITAPLGATIAPLGGTITIVSPVVMITVGATQIATLNFAATPPAVTVTFDAASTALLGPLLTAAGLTIVQAQNLMAGVVVTQLQTAIGRLDLTPPIPVVDDTDATTVFGIDVSTVNDTAAVDRDCLSFGVRMANDSGGSINNVTTSLIPAGSNSLVMMSNFWLLARVMRPRIATSLGSLVTDFDTPLRLNRRIPAPGGQGTLTQLEAVVSGNRIAVTGRATDSGTGWSAASNFSFFIDIGLDGGAITVTATTPNVDTDVDLEWWVWLASLGLGGLFGGIVGAIVAAIVLAIVEAVAEGIANGMISDGISGSLGGLPAIPLGPIGGGLTLTSIVLDDLELRSSIVNSVSVPVKASGDHSSFAGFAIDLDTGSVSASPAIASDLQWNPTSGLTSLGASGLSVTGASFGSLTAVQISRMPLGTTFLPASLIPPSIPPEWPFFSHDAVVFGVRTSHGRYAKCRAYRSVLDGGALHLDWVTYATPAAMLDLNSHWSVIESGDVTEWITPDCKFCKSFPVRRCCVIEAWPRLVAFPIDYQFCMCGEILEEGTGEVDTADGPLAYRLDGRTLYIETEMGQSVNCEVCVSAIDNRGLELYECMQLKKPGIEKRCHQCDPDRPLVAIDYVVVDANLATWRPLLAYHDAGQVRQPD